MRKVFGLVVCLLLLSVFLSGCVSTEDSTEDINTAVVENKDITSEAAAQPQDTSDTSSITADPSVTDTPEIAVDPVAEYYGDKFYYTELDSKFEPLFGTIDGYTNGVDAPTGTIGLWSDDLEFKGEQFYFIRDSTAGLHDSIYQAAFEDKYFNILSVDMEFLRDLDNDDVRAASAAASEGMDQTLKWDYVAMTAHGYHGEEMTVYAPNVGISPDIYLDIAVHGIDGSSLYDGLERASVEQGAPEDYLPTLREGLGV